MIFDEAHARRLLATFKHMDYSLESALRPRPAKRMIEPCAPNMCRTSLLRSKLPWKSNLRVFATCCDFSS
jgi:hypothetical protein